MFVVALISIAFPLPSKADNVSLSWTNPDMTEQCSPGTTYTNPGGTRIWQLVADIPDPEQAITSYVIPGMKPGTYQYVATTYDDQGVESRVSGKAEKVVTDFGVVDQRVYIVAKIPGNFLLLVVGTAPLGTPCNPNIEVNGMNAIPIDEVIFTGARDVIVVAKCG